MTTTAATVSVRLNTRRLLGDLQRLREAASASVEVRDRLAQLGELRVDDLRVHCDCLPACRSRDARICLQLPQRYSELVAQVRSSQAQCP